MENGMEFEKGQRYVNIDGEIVEIFCNKGVVIEVKKDGETVLLLTKDFESGSWKKVRMCSHCKSEFNLDILMDEYLKKQTTQDKIEMFFRRLYSKVYNGYWSVKYFFQRLFRGYDNVDIFAFDTRLATIIVKRLKEFRKIVSHVPHEMIEKCGYTSDMNRDEFEIVLAEWKKELDKMIHAFELTANDDWNFKCNCEGQADVLELKRQRGIKLFAKYYDNLWD